MVAQVLFNTVIEAGLWIVESVARVGVVTVHLLYFRLILLLWDWSKLECGTSTDLLSGRIDLLNDQVELFLTLMLLLQNFHLFRFNCFL